MLSKEVVKLLNEQINKEMYAANLYLSMSSWCYENSLDGAGAFLFAHASEESDHAKKLITYLNETDSHVELQEVKQPEKISNLYLMFLKKPMNMSNLSQNQSIL